MFELYRDNVLVAKIFDKKTANDFKNWLETCEIAHEMVDSNYKPVKIKIKVPKT